MKNKLANRQFSLLVTGSIFILFVLGQLVFTGETDYQSFYAAPLIFGSTLVLLLIQKVLNVYGSTERIRKAFFWLSLTGLLMGTLLTFPFWMFR
ncbi:MAG: hypothetical protein ABJG68_03220 [Crocinitomicaceae bacterium]